MYVDIEDMVRHTLHGAEVWKCRKGKKVPTLAGVHIEWPESCCPVEMRPFSGDESIVGPHGERIVQVAIPGAEVAKTLYGPDWDIPKVLDVMKRAELRGRHTVGQVKVGERLRIDTITTECGMEIRVIVEHATGKIRSHYPNREWLRSGSRKIQI